MISYLREVCFLSYYALYGNILTSNIENFNKKTPFEEFWDDYGGFVIFAAVVVAIVLFFFIRSFVLRMAENKQERMIEVNGSKVDPFKICSVNLTGYSTVTIPKGTVFNAPFPEKEGYTFHGWFYDSACTVPYMNTKLRTSITLYPKWVPKS